MQYRSLVHCTRTWLYYEGLKIWVQFSGGRFERLKDSVVNPSMQYNFLVFLCLHLIDPVAELWLVVLLSFPYLATFS